MDKCREYLLLLGFPLKKTDRYRFFLQAPMGITVNAYYYWDSPLAMGTPLDSPLKKLAGIGFFCGHQWANAMNAYHYWNSPLKKGDKGGCFSSTQNPISISF